ncbi:Hypothetical predicted protein [Mytilus galloprovincialis]|uniref:SH3 domain-binding glutamic acid-rich protein n=1 Tax=Mytilus galloprovincialis TaxID=29158 RepID=A0A8B6EAT8_MYTGA|nr:Hypothetical predicted protein [Mytilus galloprovincialis]
MVIKVYISSVTGNSKMRKQQQHVQSTLESFKIDFENIDISCPNNEEDKKFMRANSKTPEGSTVPLPPQIFNEEEYCGDYEDFDLNVEDNLLYEFLKMAPQKKTSEASVTVTGEKPVEEGNENKEESKGEEGGETTE